MKAAHFALLVVYLVNLSVAKYSFLPLFLQKSNQYTCLGGKNPSSQSYRQYLDEFSRGPCKPVILVPGITGTRIQIEIDYDLLKVEHPEIVKTCNWNDAHQPSKTQNIYPPNPLVNTFSNGNTYFINCFTILFKLGVKKVGDKYKVEYRKGLSYHPDWTGSLRFGLWETNQNQCGFRANNSIVDSTFGPKFAYMKPFYDNLIEMGYQPNLSMASFPYDWRPDPKSIVRDVLFGNLGKMLFLLTGKPVVVAAHSYGSQVAYYGVLQLDAKIRPQIFSDLMVIGATWLGASAPMDAILGKNLAGSADVVKSVVTLASKFENFKGLVTNLAGFYSLSLKDNFVKYRNTPWLKNVLARIDYEKTGKIPANGKIPYSNWLPNRDFFCTEEQRNMADNEPNESEKITAQCSIGLVDYNIASKINNKIWKTNEIAEMLDKYSFAKDAGLKYKSWNNNDIDNWPNPGIQTWHVFTDRIPTNWYSVYENMLEKKTGINDFNYAKGTVEAPGDGTVNTVSSLIAGLKWADDFDNNVQGAKPSRIVHSCAKMEERNKQNPKYSKFITKESQDVNQNANSYWGIECNCTNMSVYKRLAAWAGGKKMEAQICGHIPMFQDPSVFDVLRKVLTNHPGIVSITHFVNKSSDATLKEYAEECVMEKPKFLEQIDKKFGFNVRRLQKEIKKRNADDGSKH